MTDEQQMIREMVRDFAESVLPPTIEHRDANQIPPAEEWQQFLEYGLQGITIPEEYGGNPVDDISESIIIEELARVDPSFAVMFCVHVGLCAKTIALHGNEEQKSNYLTRLAAGEVGAYSLSAAGAGTDAAAMVCKAKLSDDGTHYILNGEKMWVTNGAQAQIYVLFAKDVDHPDYGVKRHGGSTAFIVEQSFEGFSVGKKEDKLGIRSSDTCTLVLENCKVPVENVLGEVGQGAPIAFNVLYPGRYKLGVTTCAGSKYILDGALNFAFEREQFSRSISNFDMVKNKFANMVAKSWESDTINYMTTGAIDQAISKLDKDADNFYEGVQKIIEDHSIESSIAKVLGSETLAYTVDEGVQVMGGAGYIEDYPMAGAYRDERINRIFEGTNEINRMIIGGYVLKKSILEEIPIRLCIQE